MKSELLIPFASPAQAAMAVKAVASDGFESARAQVQCTASGSSFKAVVTASDFAALRARTTSLLRDLRVFIDSEKAGRK